MSLWSASQIFIGNIFNLPKDCSGTILGPLRSCYLRERWVNSEGQLIANRARIWNYNLDLDQGITGCPNHRYNYGICWKSSQKCGFPVHPLCSECKPQRGMTIRMCVIIQLGLGTLCRIGTGEISLKTTC